MVIKQMGQVYPVFTDGKRFWHSGDHKCPLGTKMRFAYFSQYNFGKDFKNEIKGHEEKAKIIYENWEKRVNNF